MIGDVNLFLNDPDTRHHGELEVTHTLDAPSCCKLMFIFSST